MYDIYGSEIYAKYRAEDLLREAEQAGRVADIQRQSIAKKMPPLTAFIESSLSSYRADFRLELGRVKIRVYTDYGRG